VRCVPVASLILFLFVGCTQTKPTVPPDDGPDTSASIATSSIKKTPASPSPSRRPPQKEPAPSHPIPKQGPNILILMVDTLRADRLGCYGHKVDTSLGIDAFSQNALLFENAYATAPWTLASVAGMMTGRYPSVMGITDDMVLVDDRYRTLAQILADRGYSTGSIISHLFVGKAYNLHRGFAYYNEDNLPKNDMHISAPGVSDAGIAFLNRQTPDHPFFLFLHYFDPHYKYLMHDILNTYPDFDGLIDSKMSIHHLRSLAENDYFTDDDRRYLNALYDSEVRLSDYHVERVLGELRHLGLYDNTVIVFVADHGEELAGRPDRWIGHSRKLTQEQIRVPLIIKLPKMKQGKRIRRNVSLVDILPTLAAIVGAPVPEDIDGVPIDLDGNGGGRDIVFAETYRWTARQAVFFDQWKLVHDVKRKQDFLYELTTDPYTYKNLAGINREMVVTLEKAREAQVQRNQSTIDRMKVETQKPEISPDDETRLHLLGYVH
jgi:arylsulfatase A-like enzyme